MNKTFYSNGKLLITGEYLVLDGAKAFALPTKFGQYLTVKKSEDNLIHWKSYDVDGSIWFETALSYSSIINKELFNGTENIKNTLVEILHEAYNLNSDFITIATGYEITTQLTFPRFWGLGTSSTLINNIAQWIDIDAFTLLKNSFGGSGYDIACAQNNSGIIYQLIDHKPFIENIKFNPKFTDKIYFVYLNQKQNSKSAIQTYNNKHNEITNAISLVNNLTSTVVATTDVNEFIKSLKEHEFEMSKILEQKTVQELLFSDFNGVIKSLGAWGGDFVMVVSNENPTYYFNKKGFQTVLSYSEIIL